MITIDQIKEHLAKFTYKPGWTFRIDGPFTWGDYQLVGVYWADNSEYSRDRITVIGTEPIPAHMLEYMDLHAFDMVVLTHLLRKADQHEMEEWLRYDGVRVVDPHLKS